MHTVKTVAAMAGVTIRTLHHYDRIGLLTPAATSPAGYRLYDDKDLARLQQILFFRELGFGLAEIATLISHPDFDRRQALIEHRRVLVAQRERLADLIASLDRTVEAIERGTSMDAQAMFDGFDSAQMEAYRREARERWGAELVDESHRRVAHDTKADWAALAAERDDISRQLAGLMDRDPADPAVQAQIDRHFRTIDGRFYDCSAEVYRGLGELYVDDARFSATYEVVRPGLARFMREAMRVYSDRLAPGP